MSEKKRLGIRSLMVQMEERIKAADKKIAALERAADAAQELVEAATKTEQARARYEYIRHQKPLDTNAELRHWLQLMQALLDQKAALSALQPDAASGGGKAGGE